MSVIYGVAQNRREIGLMSLSDEIKEEKVYGHRFLLGEFMGFGKDDGKLFDS